MAKQSEGAAVRRAHDGPDIEHDKLLGFIEARNREDKDRASSAGESRQKIGTFLDESGMNGKALSWCRQIVKVSGKSDGQNKAMDIIRSLEAALPMVKNHVGGQQAEMFDGEPEPVEPVGDEDDPRVPPPDDGEEGDEEIAQETAEFEDAVAALDPDSLPMAAE